MRLRGALIVSIILMARLGWAEGTPSSGGAAGRPPGGIAVVNPSGAPVSGGMGQPLSPPFEPDFFSPTTGSGVSVPGTSPKGREYDDMPDYTTDQREAWLKKCAVYKDQDSKLFRDCFQKEREKMRMELREKFDAVERRQGGGRTSYEDLLQPQKSSGGFD